MFVPKGRRLHHPVLPQLSAGNSLNPTRSRTASIPTPLYSVPNVLTPSRNPDLLLLLYLHKQISVNSLPISVLPIPQASPLLAYFREMVSKSQMLNLELLRCCEKYKCEWPYQPSCAAQTVSGHIAECSNVTDYCVFTMYFKLGTSLQILS